MTNYDIYKLVKSILRKDDRGYSKLLSNFTNLLQQASLDQYKEKYQQYSYNQDISDSFSPFEVIVPLSSLTTSSTVVSLPNDYAHFVDMYWTDSGGYDRAFDLVTDDEWDMRHNQVITYPTDSHPICKIVGDYLYVSPMIDSTGTGLLLYYGVGSPSLTMSEIELLSSVEMSVGDKALNFSPNDEVQYFAYPQSYGVLSSILDDNGFETISDWTLRSEVSGTADYYVYEFVNQTIQTDFTYIFKF